MCAMSVCYYKPNHANGQLETEGDSDFEPALNKYKCMLIDGIDVTAI